ncbi:MAG: hypothetical protein F6J89_24560 [Symploca sp. SIO1C4]|uniref:Uncharacterized protein n=1 Tax=Symploca sp. SIO1C4 TaxID=2607765 RepID=A0A6B3NC72_9CYAN|nr:hypothetical protein [Symploca sp. SIO1C4]
MPSQKYTFRKGEGQIIEVSLTGPWFRKKDLVVRLDGQKLDRFTDTIGLRGGEVFRLQDGSILRVKLVDGLFDITRVQVFLNGDPLPGSLSNLRQKLARAYGAIYFTGGFNVFFGLASMLSPFIKDSVGLRIDSFIVGTIFLLLGYFVQRKSLLALRIAIALFILTSLVTTISTLQTDSSNTSGIGSRSGIALRIGFIFVMWQGMEAITEMEAITDNEHQS